MVRFFFQLSLEDQSLMMCLYTYVSLITIRSVLWRCLFTYHFISAEVTPFISLKTGASPSPIRDKNRSGVRCNYSDVIHCTNKEDR